MAESNKSSPSDSTSGKGKTGEIEADKGNGNQGKGNQSEIPEDFNIPCELVQHNTRHDWLEWRKGKIGASDIPIAMGISPFTKRFDLLMQKTGHAPRPKTNYAMEYGIKREPFVLKEMIKRTGRNFVSQTYQSKIFPWMVAQVDGCDGEVLLEIKCPTSKRLYSEALSGVIPDHYVAQMQAQLFVTGLKVCVFVVSYSNELVSLECKADPLLQKRIVESSVEFLLDMRKVGPKNESLRNALEQNLSFLQQFPERLEAWYQFSIQSQQSAPDSTPAHQGNLLDSMLDDHMSAQLLQ